MKQKLITTLCLILLQTTSLFAVQEVTIPKGSNAKQIVAQLKQAEMIRFKTPFYLYLRLSGATQNLRAGTFMLDSSYSYRRLANILQEKEGAASLSKVTIPEGYSIIEIATELKKEK